MQSSSTQHVSSAEIQGNGDRTLKAREGVSDSLCGSDSSSSGSGSNLVDGRCPTPDGTPSFGCLFVVLNGLALPPVPARAATLVLGRGEGCGLVLSDPSVSRQHADLAFRGGRAFVRDRGSANGCLIRAAGGTVVVPRGSPPAAGRPATPSPLDAPGGALGGALGGGPGGGAGGNPGGGGGAAGVLEVELPPGAALHLGAAKVIWVPPGAAPPPSLPATASFSLPASATIIRSAAAAAAATADDEADEADEAYGAAFLASDPLRGPSARSSSARAGARGAPPGKRSVSADPLSSFGAAAAATMKRARGPLPPHMARPAATTASPATASSSSSYDVFLSHRQVDAQDFCALLYDRLCARG